MGKHIGELSDPHTGETMSVEASPLKPGIPYRKANGTFGDMLNDDARNAWPADGAYWLSTSNGRTYAEISLDINGWWLTCDSTYMPIARAHRSAWREFVIQLGEGLSNGYPLRDVLVYAWNDARRRRG